MNTFPIIAEDKIQSVPLINLEELSPTFEEEKEQLEKVDIQNTNIQTSEKNEKKIENKKKSKNLY